MGGKYICIVTSDNTHERAYSVNSTSAMKAAMRFGRGEAGEIVTIMTKRTRRIISRVMWWNDLGGYHHHQL